MRLFPALLVATLFGGIALAIAARVAQPSWFAAVHGGNYAAISQHFLPHLFAHATMLHGAVPNALLDSAQYSFVPPAWSVSLEWQFYLVAPFAIWLCRTRGGAVALVGLIVVLSFVYHHELKAQWDRPSMLAGSARWFLIGIAARFAAPRLAGLVDYPAAVGLGAGFTLLWLGTPALAMWLAVYSFILRRQDVSGGVDGLYIGAMRLALESRPIQALAERSYSTYLLHWPVILLIGAVATASGVPTGRSLLVVMLLTVPITLILQEPVYRFVEMPGRALGKRWTSRFGAAPVAEVATETFSPQAAR